MRLTILRTVTVFCALLAAPGAILAQPQVDQNAAAQCQGKPNLTAPVTTLDRVDFLAGFDPAVVTDDVVMVDFDVAIENASTVDAPRSKLRYEAVVRTTDGALVEKSNDILDIYGPVAGGVEHALISVMVSKLAACLQPSGEIAANIVIRAVADVDNEVDECDETDNVSETAFDIGPKKVDS